MKKSPDNFPFSIEDRYFRYNYYLRQTFGEKIYRISLDAGFTCPTRDGTLGYGGCLYCNNRSFSPNYRTNLLPISQQLSQGIERLHKVCKANKFLAYFQSFTNTYAPVEKLEKLYREALVFSEIVGICIGTRPDCVNDEIFELLEEINKEAYVSIELGIESVYDKSLKWANRGHTFEKTKWAIQKAKEYGLHVAGHYILGFPTETKEEMLKATDIINTLEVNALKIHHLHIVNDSRLADLYKQKPFHVFDEYEWIEFVCSFLERLNPKIVIQRLMGDAMPGTLLAPKWKMNKGEILRKIKQELESRESYQGSKIIMNCEC